MKSKQIVEAWDYKDPPYDELKIILKKFGIHMYELPSCEGSDTYGFIFSNEKISKKEIEELDFKE